MVGMGIASAGGGPAMRGALPALGGYSGSSGVLAGRSAIAGTDRGDRSMARRGASAASMLWALDEC
jgi:hypothetical protein